MKQVIAFVQPFMANRIVDALHGIAGISGGSGGSVTPMRGFGRGRQRLGSQEDLIGTAPRVRIDVMVADTVVAEVVKAIRDTAHTGNRGDGKVYVVPLERAVRISTGEEGDAAV